MTFPFQVSDNGNITVIIDGEPYTASTDHPNYDEIKNALWENVDSEEMRSLIDIPKSVIEYSEGNIEIRDGQVYYNDNLIDNVLTDRILKVKKNGFPFAPMLRFLEKLMSNPSRRAIKELYTFLQHKDLPIDEDGDFLAYKAIRSNWTDKFTGEVSNTVGTVNEIPRNEVDDDFGINCSEGFHVGSMNYVAGYGKANDLIVLVKVNPADVVSVPSDSSCQKCRTCRYEVIKEIKADAILRYDQIHTRTGAVSQIGNFNQYAGRSDDMPFDEGNDGWYDDDDDNDSWYDDNEDDSYLD